ncbi:MAG: Wzz/FepE/Etk N-terminal domain-containing protein, partial [Bdellovibrio sp.]
MTEQQIEPELTVGEIIKVYLSHWRMFVLFTTIFFALAALVYVLKIPFVANSTIVVNDSQNSSLQAFSNQFFGLSKAVQESKKGSSLLSKHIEYLKTREFFESFLTYITVRSESPLISMEEKNGFDILKLNYMADLNNPAGKIEFLQRLDRWLKVQSDSDF